MEAMSILGPLLVILASILFVLSMVDIIKSTRTRKRNEYLVVWVMMVLMFPIFGPIIYFQMRRRV